jgi:para-nitrobenzyl esterase
MNNIPTVRLFAILFTMVFGTAAPAQERVKVAGGVLEGTNSAGIRIFRGIPFAAPPVGDLRWKPPQPAGSWKGVRDATRFGPRAMQRNVFGDMVFRASGTSEDCLYLNVWTPANTAKEKLPVLVYFYGGGFVAGDGSEPRYDGESMARKGMVAVTVNYRLGVFGFFAHPELAKESPHHAAGNYGLLDQAAALKWVQKNIRAFGGDPTRVTIAGESAGSISVSAQMASPLSKRLIAGAIGESGSILGALSAVPLAEAEQAGVKFADGLGLGEKPTLAALRGLSADRLLEATAQPGMPRFRPTVDGYFFPKPPPDIFAAGEQAHVPLLAGSNTEESGFRGVLGRDEPTVENYRKALERLYPGKGEAVFKLYPASNETEVMDAAQDLAGDRFIAMSTWKWVDLATKTGRKPTYYYLYARPRPAMASGTQNQTSRGAVHSAEIEYALGNLHYNKVYAWTPDDYQVSRTLQNYFANFIKTGSPNGPGLPNWPEFKTGQRMIIDLDPRPGSEQHVRARYELLEQLASGGR